MTSFDDSIGTQAFPMPFLTTMLRQRAKPITDPSGLAYDEDWSNPDILRFDGYLASQSSTESADGTHPRDTGTTTTKQIVLPDPTVDIREHDRIIIQGDAWQVTGVGERDKNPFTGWQPTLVVSIERFQGGV